MSSGSCCERVFVDDAPDPVVSTDAVVVEVGDRCGQRPQRSGLGEGAVGAMLVVMSFVFAEDVS